MPLPDRNQSWPPKALEPVLARIDLWSAWYSGEPADLQAALAGGAVDSGFNVFGEQTPRSRAGLVNRVAGWFWSQPKPQNAHTDVQLHIPVASDIAAMSADIVFGQAPDLSLPDTASESPETQGRLEEYVLDGLISDLREAAEIASALGGVYLRVVWDPELSSRPWLQAVHPDIAVPEFRFGRLSAVTFWREILADAAGRVVRHLERHEPGYIFHAVYDGTRSELGRRSPLGDFLETAELAALVDQNSGIPTGTPLLTAVYVPNMRPNRIWRRVPEATYWGRSDFQGIEGAMDRFDMVWSSWMRDVRLGLARLIVPQSALTTFGPGQGAYFDLDRELMVGMDLSLGPDEGKLSQVQFAIRVEEHARTCQELLEQIVRGAGYSIQTFTGESQGQALTATEIAAREKRTLTTRDKKIGYWSQAVGQALEVLLAVDVEQFGPDGVNVLRPRIEFGDAISESPAETAQTIQMLDAAKAVSLRTKIAMAHPDWTPDQVDAEALDIKDETPAVPAGLGPGNLPPDAVSGVNAPAGSIVGG
jgi:hypothetical protein